MEHNLMDKNTFEKLISAGIRAPSGDNMQPWRVSPYEGYNGFKLTGEPTEHDFLDLDKGSTFFSSGAFLENILIAARELNYASKISYDNPSLDNLANVKFSKGRDRIDINSNYIFKRRTNRNNFFTTPLPEGIKEEIENFSYDGSGVKLFPNASKCLKDILIEGDVFAQCFHPTHETIFSSVRYSSKDVEEKRDGLDYRSLGLPAPFISSRIVSSWGFKKKAINLGLLQRALRNGFNKHISNSAGLGVVYSQDNSPRDWISSGRSFERAWLNFTKEGFVLQPYTAVPLLGRFAISGSESFSPSERNYMKELYLSLKNESKIDGEPVMAFRYGIPKKEDIYSLRRPVSDFIK